MWTRIKRTLRVHLLAFIIMILTPTRVYNSEHYDALKLDIIAFERHHDPFVRGVFGCPPLVEINRQNCRPGLATIRVKDFENARKAAAKLYSLKLE